MKNDLTLSPAESELIYSKETFRGTSFNIISKTSMAKIFHRCIFVNAGISPLISSSFQLRSRGWSSTKKEFVGVEVCYFAKVCSHLHEFYWYETYTIQLSNCANSHINCTIIDSDKYANTCIIADAINYRIVSKYFDPPSTVICCFFVSFLIRWRSKVIILIIPCYLYIWGEWAVIFKIIKRSPWSTNLIFEVNDRVRKNSVLVCASETCFPEIEMERIYLYLM